MLPPYKYYTSYINDYSMYQNISMFMMFLFRFWVNVWTSSSLIWITLAIGITRADILMIVKIIINSVRFSMKLGILYLGISLTKLHVIYYNMQIITTKRHALSPLWDKVSYLPLWDFSILVMYFGWKSYGDVNLSVWLL